MPRRTLTAPWWTPWPSTGPGHDLLGDLSGLTLLELGCGNGDNAAAFARGGAEVTAVDHNPARLAQARRRWHGVDRLRFETAGAADRRLPVVDGTRTPSSHSAFSECFSLVRS
jgi:SAM-dependent methyltransferase